MDLEASLHSILRFQPLKFLLALCIALFHLLTLSLSYSVITMTKTCPLKDQANLSVTPVTGFGIIKNMNSQKE